MLGWMGVVVLMWPRTAGVVPMRPGMAHVAAPSGVRVAVGAAGIGSIWPEPGAGVALTEPGMASRICLMMAEVGAGAAWLSMG